MLPIFKILSLWIIGVLLIPFNPLNKIETSIVLLFFTLVFLGVSFLKGSSYKQTSNLLLVFIVIAVVQFLTIASKNSNANTLAENTEYSLVIKVKKRYKQNHFHNKYIVEVEASIGDSVTNIFRDYLLIQKRDSIVDRFLPGDRFVTTVFLRQFMEPKHKALFDSKKYWNLKGVEATIWLQKNNVEYLEPSSNWYYTICKLQIKWIELIYKQNISEETKQILAALLLGDKRGVSKDISNQFSRLGLVHTLALSGLHISFIYGVCAFLLSILLKYRPRFQSLILVLIIISYAILTGLSPSVMRASLMFLLYAFSLMINRRTTAFNVVFLSALILLVYKSNLIYDVGFQLSYMAVIGIIYFYNKFKVYLANRSVIVKFIFGLALVSISAQLSTGLLSVYYFNSFPLSFLWANIIILPLITLLLYQGLLYLIVLIIGFNFNLFDLIIDQSIVFILTILGYLERYSFAPIQIYLSKMYLILFYGLLLLICVVFVEKHFKYLKLFYAYVLTLVLYFMYTGVYNKMELFVNASSQGYVVSVIANNEQVLISNQYDAVSYLLGDYSLSNAIICVDSLSMKSVYKNEFLNLSDGLIQLFDEKLLLVSDEKLNVDASEFVDLLLMQKYRTDVISLNKVFTPKVVLLDAAIPSWNRLKLKKQWLDLNVELIDLKTHAYVKSY